MALEFRVDQVDGKNELYIDAQDSLKDKGMMFTLINGRSEQLDFDYLGLSQLYELGTFINIKIGFEMFNLSNIKKEMQNEKP